MSLNAEQEYRSLKIFSGFFILTGLVFTAMIYLKMEQNSGLPYLLVPVFISWPFYYWASEKWKPVFYFLPFIALLFYAFGVICGIMYLALSAFFIFWWHMPFPKIIRLSGLLAVVGFLVMERVGYFGMARVGLIIPYVATVFMFRLIIYLQEIKYKKVNEPVWMRVAYFLQPGNLVFLLYPIVDYRKFVNAYNPAAYKATLQTAVERLYRSLFHYLVYRAIYYYVAVPFTEVQDAAVFLIYAVSGYMLILRISSIYYLCLAILGLFGFNLPNPFNFYFLTPGFAQLWVRINIFWREYILRIFYYPFYFKTRGVLGDNAIWIGTMFSFVASWFMHYYQLFWLRGSYELKTTDMVYWLIIGLGVTAAVFLIQKKKIMPFRPENHLRFPAAVLLGIRVVLMFLLMSFLWVMWQCGSVREWGFQMTKLASLTMREGIIIFLVFAFVVVAGAAVWIAYERKFKKYFTGMTNYIFWVMPFIVLVIFLVEAEKNNWLKGAEFTQAFGNGLNLADKQVNEQGYYDQIMQKNGTNRLPWESQLAPPLDWSQSNGATRNVNNILLRELKPSIIIHNKKTPIQTNRLGMRDKEYAQLKEHATTRFILLGGSYEVGSGVRNNEIYEALTEDSINRLYTQKGKPQKIEIMNMALGGYYLPQALWIVENRIQTYKPDYVIYAAHADEGERLISTLARLITLGTDLRYDFLLTIKEESGVRQYMSHSEIKNRLYPYRMRLVSEGYNLFAKLCRERGAIPVWMFVPVLDHKPNAAETKKLRQLATAKGFVTLTLAEAFAGIDHHPLMVAPNDNHPNAKGHKLLSKIMVRELYENVLSLSRPINQPIYDKK